MSQKSYGKRNGAQLPLALRKELRLESEQLRQCGRRNHHDGKAAADGAELPKESKRRGKQGETENEGISYRKDAQRRRKEPIDDYKRPNRQQSHALSRRSVISHPHDTKPPQSRSGREKALEQVFEPDYSTPERSRSSSPALVLDAHSTSFKQHAKENDEEIAALERKLGVSKKTNGSRLGDDMLDFVLDGLEDEQEDVKKRKRAEHDYLTYKRLKLNAGKRNSKREVSVGSTGFKSKVLSTEYSDTTSSTMNEDDLLDEGELDGTVSSDSFIDDKIGEDEVNLGRNLGKPPKVVRENPYVAPVVATSRSEKYVPPSLRMRNVNEDVSLNGLRRQIQGLLNKLSETNMISILQELEKLYRLNARQDVTTVLIDLIIVSFSARAALQNTFIILHAAFLAAVYKVIGIDFGAELLSRVVAKFDHEQSQPDGGKEALNLISLLANLFTFNVVSSTIVYDYVRLLLSDFSEGNAERLLRVVRDCGPQLRTDDPSALKSIVQMMHDTSTDMMKRGQSPNIRTKVMMDAILDLKNNKVRNSINAAGVTGEHITRMRKTIGSLSNRTLKATEPLRLSRNDIANSDKRGKWWLVGASWKDVEPATSTVEAYTDEFPVNDYKTRPTEDDVDLLALAKQYRMNTDVRRSIFVGIMSANDCRDAQMRLAKLRLSTKQEQEIAKVLLRCARAEPSYNPYYTLLAKSLCKDNKKVRVGFQFGLWDFFARMGEKVDDESDDEGDDAQVEMHEIANLARLYAYLIFHGHLTIGVLKTLNIGFLKDQATMFLEILLTSIMTQPKVDEEYLIKVFSKAADTPQIVKSLQYFIKNNVRKSDLVPVKDKQRVKQGCRVAHVALRMIESARID